MPRYQMSIYVRHPRTGTYHMAAVNQGFQLERDRGSGRPGEIVPREAFARTLCNLREPDFRYGEPHAPAGIKVCSRCY